MARNHAVDPECNYCLQCGGEYRAEVRRCADCTADLISGREIIERQQQERQPADCCPIRPDDDLVSIQSGPLLQMQMVQVLLKRKGIPSLAAGESSGTCGCGGPNLVIQVRRADAKEAQAVLVREHLRSTGLSEQELAVAGAVFDAAADSTLCPACGCHFSTSLNTCPDCGLCFA
ncbi:hypothetical protein [Candidatus Electronema sp. TJ]|uniref:zinc ribbon-containing (seleno)protein DG n=1 Tax=Candidatus Electronema sp. TJ TaxID=3401573 RepID=UPI003AA83713